MVSRAVANLFLRYIQRHAGELLDVVADLPPGEELPDEWLSLLRDSSEALDHACAVLYNQPWPPQPADPATHERLRLAAADIAARRRAAAHPTAPARRRRKGKAAPAQAADKAG